VKETAITQRDLAREELLSDPLTMLLQGLETHQASTRVTTSDPLFHADASVAPPTADPGDSLIVAATLELIMEAANALPSDGTGH
jgi:hypothetical protein